MADYEYNGYSDWSTKSYSWGTAKTRCWVGAYRDIGSTSVTVYMHGAVQCDSLYNLAQYGVHVQVGHEGGNGTPAWATSDHRGDAVFDGTNSWIPYDYCRSYDEFKRTTYDYTVRFYCSYWGETVSGYGACSNSGTAYIDVTIPALPTCTITYNSNEPNGTNSVSTETVKHGVPTVIRGASSIGYTFVEWNTSKNGSGTSYIEGNSYSFTESKTLYAIWTPNTYDVKFNANGGSNAPKTQTKTYGIDLTITNSVPTKDKYNFLGWATSQSKANAGSVAYKSGSKYTKNESIELYAVWELAYNKPNISDITLIRCDKSGNKSSIGKYIKVSFNWKTDEQLALTSGEIIIDGSHVETIDGTDSDKGSVTKIIGGNLSPIKDHKVNISISDTEKQTFGAINILKKEEYSAPVVSKIKAVRATEDRAEDGDSECGLITFDWSIDEMEDNSNSISNITVAYQEHGANYIEYPNKVTVEYNSESASSTATAFVSGNVLDLGKSYDFKITVKDKVSSTVKYTIITYSFCTIDFKAEGKGIAIGKYAEEDILDIDMDTRFRKEVEINGRKYGENQILWSSETDENGAKFLGQGSAVKFDYGKSNGELHKVSEQPHGIVLAFSYFDNDDDTAENATWSCHFVPKSMIGNGGLDKKGSHTFLMATFTPTVDAFGIKHVYISDSRIDGYNRNGLTVNEYGTSDCGIKFSNNKYVLRYVIGV